MSVHCCFGYASLFGQSLAGDAAETGWKRCTARPLLGEEIEPGLVASMNEVARRIVIFVCLCGCVVGCSPQEKRPTSEDILVLTTVLTSFLANDAREEVVLMGQGEPTTSRSQLLVAEDSLVSADLPSAIELEQAASRVGGKLSSDAILGLRARNRVSVALEILSTCSPAFRLTSWQQINWAPGEFSRAHPDARAYTRLWLPGYNKQGSLAIVVFCFGPSFHGSRAIYKLDKTQGIWRVNWHSVVHYM